ncbi:hypothetical protein HY640_04765 [Candidatus Woesearchaeota archaeon]|nr:hypothetical protein [Candidatus Woesearchaeota archaeon]
MKRLEENIKRSFLLAKRDIAELKSSLNEVSTELGRTIEHAAKLSEQLRRYEQNGNIPKKGMRSQKLIGARKSMVMHKENCPFAKRILPKNRELFRSKTAALNKGYKPCECLKK